MKQKNLIEDLAIERTKLAEERTHLAYIRTGLNMLLAGIFFVGYFPVGSLYSYVGYITVIISVIFTIYGFYYHRKSKEMITKVVRGAFNFKREIK